MRTQPMSYLYRCNNIGQVKEEEANQEIKRLERQTAKRWFKDYSKILMPYIYAELREGYCWIISDDNPTSTIRLSLITN